METNAIVKAFENELNLTEKGFVELKKRKDGLVIDVTNDDGFKLARKERTERNKILTNIDRLAIDGKAKIDEARETLKSRVSEVYSLNITAFENEDAKRKADAERKRIKEQERVDAIHKKIDSIRGMVGQARGQSSSTISDIIESVDMIDPADNFDEFTQEAAQAIRETILELNGLLTNAITQENIQREREEIAKERDEVADELAKLRAENEALKKQQEAKQVLDPVEVEQPVIEEELPLCESQPDQEKQEEAKVTRQPNDYEQGYIDGLKAYAWIDRGIEYVGKEGQTLEAAIDLFLNKGAA